VQETQYKLWLDVRALLFIRKYVEAATNRKHINKVGMTPSKLNVDQAEHAVLASDASCMGNLSTELLHTVTAISLDW
jgi:hypothetical protein